MIPEIDMNRLSLFLDALGMDEPPMGLYYTNTLPAQGVSPRRQTPLHRLTKDNNQINWNACLLAKVALARKKQCPAFFDAERYGCLGGAFFMGFKPHYESFEPALVSTGIPGKMEGERYADSPRTGKKLYDGFKPPLAGGRVLVIQPLDLFMQGTPPEIVIFFPTRDSLIALNGLTLYITRDPNAVVVPFGMGCAATVSWPRRLALEKQKKAVIGGFDINTTRYLKSGEVSYAVSYDIFLRMLAIWPQSLMSTRSWQRLKKKKNRHTVLKNSSSD